MTARGTVPAAEGEIIRRNGGWLRPWRPGETGNPGGIGGEYARVRSLAKSKAMDAMQELVNLLGCDDERIRYMAAMAILERGVGKPRDHSNEDDALAKLDLTKLSAEDQAKLAELLGRVMGVRG